MMNGLAFVSKRSYLCRRFDLPELTQPASHPTSNEDRGLAAIVLATRIVSQGRLLK